MSIQDLKIASVTWLNQQVAAVATAVADAVAARNTAVTAKTDAVAARADAVAARDAAADSATSASTSATNASTSAGTASSAATSASTSAGTATTAKTDAVTARTDAVTARDAAVAARDETVIAVGASVDWTGTVTPTSADVSQSRWWKRRLTGNTVLNLPDGVAGKAYSLIVEVKQDATGGRTLVVNQSGGVQVSWAYGVTPVMSSAANARDLWTLTWTGSEWVGGIGGQALAIGTGTGV